MTAVSFSFAFSLFSGYIELLMKCLCLAAATSIGVDFSDLLCYWFNQWFTESRQLKANETILFIDHWLGSSKEGKTRWCRPTGCKINAIFSISYILCLFLFLFTTIECLVSIRTLKTILSVDMAEDKYRKKLIEKCLKRTRFSIRSRF